jgi:eukaryotic-like serine/threonine-protein kinase
MSLREELQRSLGGAYTIERELGGGGMSHVFVATETGLSRSVVVKVLSPELAAGLSGSRFAREIRLAASLQQANIVPLLSAGEFDGRPYYTMPFVDGLSLRQRVSGGPLPIGEVISVLRDVARALAYAHERGVVHRDIKPDNVLLSGDAAVVTDFGIAKALIRASTMTPDGEGAARADASVVTQIGTAIGTPAYMAPEQGVGDPSTDHRADLYALGCLGYELLCGETPFHARPVHQTFLAHVNEAPVPIDARRPDCPPGLARVVMQCLEKDPGRRPQSAREVLQGLDSISTASATTTPHRPSRARAAAVALAAVIVVVVVTLLIARRPRASAASADGVKTLAVLPFANVGGDSAREYLVDGMTDELATAFGKLPGVRVAARTSTYRYKSRVASGTGIDPREVGRTLAVGFVLVGSIRPAGQQLVASAQLADANTGQEIWSDTFHSDAKDLFTLQSGLAREITAALAPRLSTGRASAGATVPAHVAQGTGNQDAYDLYLRGRFLLAARRTLPRAVEIFQQAIDKDSSFARAYAALGETLEYLPYFNGVPADSVGQRAMRAAQHALAIDSTLAQAHVALGLGHMHAFEWNEAGDEFRRAIATDSNDVSALTQYARYLLYVGRPTEALAVITRAATLEPYSPVISAWKVSSLSLLGRHEEALAESRRGMEVDSTSPPLIQISTLAYLAANRTADAVSIAMRGPLKGPPFGGNLALAIGKSGDRPTALRMAHEFDGQMPHWFSASTAALGYLGVGDTARALDDFEKATNAREIWPSFAPVCDYAFDAIRASKRFAALMRRVGLDDALLTRPGACRVK